MRWPQKALPVWTFQSCLTRAYPHSLRKTPANKNDGDIYTTYGSLLDIPLKLSEESIFEESEEFQQGLLHMVAQAAHCTTPGTAISLDQSMMEPCCLLRTSQQFHGHVTRRPPGMLSPRILDSRLTCCVTWQNHPLSGPLSLSP